MSLLLSQCKHTHASKHMMNCSSRPALEWNGAECCKRTGKEEPERPLLPPWCQGEADTKSKPSNEALNGALVLLQWTVYPMSKADLKERPSFDKIRSMTLNKAGTLSRFQCLSCKTGNWDKTLV